MGIKQDPWAMILLMITLVMGMVFGGLLVWFIIEITKGVTP